MTDQPSSQRRALHAYLSPAAHDTWHDFATEHGVSVSALLEALSEPLTSGLPEVSIADVLDGAVTSARATDAARRRRSRTRRTT